MRKGFLGSIAALAAGAGTAWAQPPAPLAPPVGTPVVAPGPVGAEPPVAVPRFGGFSPNAIPGNSGFAPAPTIMPPGNYGPPEDPLGLGPVGGFGPPPGPMYPVPGPYAQQSWQPAPPGAGGGGGGGDLGSVTAPKWWFDGEYLAWFTRGQQLGFPVLTSSAPSDAGLLGQASTAILAGNRDLGYGLISGMRLRAGFFGDADRRIGFQIEGFFTEHKPNNQTFGTLSNTAGTPTLARPFIDVNGVPGAVVLSGPNFGAAVVRVRTDTQTIGVEPAGVWNIYRSEPGCSRVWSLDFLAGYKFLQLRENLVINSYTQLDNQIALPVFTTGPFGQIIQTTSIVPAQVPLGGTIVGGPAVVQVRDQFRATNRFNGAVFGFRSEGRYGMFTTSLTGKISVGYLNERVEIAGNTTFVDPLSRSGTPGGFGFASGVGGSGGAVGGVLANPANIGTFNHDRFSYIPELGANFGIALTRGLTGYIGVSFIYFPDVVRVGSTVNPVVSSSSIPFSPSFGTGGARGPGFRFAEEDFWIGGVSAGLMLRY